MCSYILIPLYTNKNALTFFLTALLFLLTSMLQKMNVSEMGGLGYTLGNSHSPSKYNLPPACQTCYHTKNETCSLLLLVDPTNLLGKTLCLVVNLPEMGVRGERVGFFGYTNVLNRKG